MLSSWEKKIISILHLQSGGAESDDACVCVCVCVALCGFV